MANEQALDFVARYPDAAMITLRADGTAHMARIEVATFDSRVWATGAEPLVRTKNLRRDPRCSLFVFGAHPHWLGLETTASIIDGPDAPGILVRLLRARHGDATPPGTVLAHDDQLGHDRPWPEADYLEHAHAHRLLAYSFTIIRTYGNP
ncbi:pyridoxamine 5'-phosphate oxidase family protein [Pseudofrankia inefficax]|uniref:Pyridoxamine 5'-phosphate oxidase-related FMN-binding protein n=1 Tax=Pseudofrankia inefficax (strain DSM 45817 / CECT 9037 / DDB 130130 / EuI1c) TaxID=298654 RepID=E3JDA2_PSEI1|nr:pyridoxamine 5'-phosphate oxidase family protein [Pseudofrankia inefficax]ADP82386.1 pyridoxamine 5'-phosphate oxidase-related FMN-binding protein [Pseudofrankia inefficax]